MQNLGDNDQVGAAAADDGDNRSAHRRRTLKKARVVLSDSTVVDCELRDVSDAGAHLVFGGPVSLPETFRLYNVSDGLLAPAELKWQRGLEAGVTLTGAWERHAAL
jgi:hypothetical protein